MSVNGRLIVILPDETSAEMPSRGQVAVVGAINRQAIQTVIEPDGRRGHWISIDPQFALACNIEAGDVVSLELTPTRDWPEPAMPNDLRTALDEAPDVTELWSSITPMARWEWVRWIQATKNANTRAKRVTVSISKMRSGKRRPCCFDLSACTDPQLAMGGKLIVPER